MRLSERLLYGIILKCEHQTLTCHQAQLQVDWSYSWSVLADLRCRLRLHGTGQIFSRSKICTVHTVYTEPSLFLHERIFRLHGTGYLTLHS